MYPNAQWRLDAACAGKDSNLFYPTESRNPTIRERRIRQARGYCSVCPVRPRCLDEALETDDRFAIMGGLTYPERQGGAVAAHLASALVANLIADTS